MLIRRCIILLLLLVSCSKPRPDPAAKKPFIVVGRYDDADPKGIRFSWPGTQIRARFKGESVAVDLLDDGANEMEWSVDGSAPVRFSTKGPRRVFPLTSKLAPGEHELVLTKRTEAAVGMLQLFAINADLVGTPPLPPSTRRIEMIGDSITAGYGILGDSASCPFSPETEDEGIAWGALAAKDLSAVHTAVAWSGIGLYRNWDRTLLKTMPKRYPTSLADEHPGGWRHSEFPPDVIVLALGTNDFAAGDPGEPFLETLQGFLRTLRALHKTTPIVLATSPMLMGEQHAAQRRYFTRAIERAADPRLSLLDVEARPDEGLGCDAHPNAITHRRMANLLVKHLKPLLGW